MCFQRISWQIQPVSSSDFKGLERGWFLCNVGNWISLKGIRKPSLNSSAGYSLVFSWIKWKSPSLKPLFHRMSVKPMSPGPVSLQHRYWRRWYTSWWNARDFGGFRSGLQGGNLRGRSFQVKNPQFNVSFFTLKWCFEVGVDFINRDPRWLYSAWAVWFVLIII